MKNRVRELRKARKITQQQLAGALGVSLATIQNWEAEKTDMTGYSLAMLCDYFDASPNQIYGTGEPSPDWELKSQLLDCFGRMSTSGREALVAIAIDLEEFFPEIDHEAIAAGDWAGDQFDSGKGAV